MMSVLDLFVQAASRAVGASKVVEVADLRLDRWVVVDSPKRLRVVVEPIEPGRFAGRVGSVARCTARGVVALGDARTGRDHHRRTTTRVNRQLPPR